MVLITALFFGGIYVVFEAMSDSPSVAGALAVFVGGALGGGLSAWIGDRRARSGDRDRRPVMFPDDGRVAREGIANEGTFPMPTMTGVLSLAERCLRYRRLRYVIKDRRVSVSLSDVQRVTVVRWWTYPTAIELTLASGAKLSFRVAEPDAWARDIRSAIAERAAQEA